MSDAKIREAVHEALQSRKRELDQCPARQSWLGDICCPQCGAGTAGPCWLNVGADATFVDTIKEIIK